MFGAVTELERILVRFVGDGSSYQRAAKDVMATNDKIRRIGMGMQALGTRAFVSMTLPIVGLVGLMGKLAAGAETTRVQFETMLGKDKGNALLDKLREFAAVTPFMFSGVAGSGRTLLSFGVQQEEVMDVLKMVGDVAAGTGKDFQELSVIYGQIKGMGRLLGQDFLQLVNSGFPVIEIAKTMGITMGELRKKMEEGAVPFDAVQETFKRVTSEGGIYNNMMEKLSQTTEGKWSTMMDNLILSGQKLGAIFIPMINKVIDTVIKAVEWFGNLDPSIQNSIMMLGGIIAAVGPGLIIVGKLFTGIAAVGGLIASFAGIVSMGLVPLVVTFGAIVGLVSLVGYGLYNMGNQGEAIGSAFKSMGEKMKEWGMTAIGFFANFQTNFRLLSTWMGDNWQSVLLDMGNMMKTFAENIFHNLKAEFAGVLAAITTFFQAWWQTIIHPLQSAKDIFSGKFLDEYVGKMEAVLERTGNMMRMPLKGFVRTTPDLPEFETKFLMKSEKEAKKDVEEIKMPEMPEMLKMPEMPEQEKYEAKEFQPGQAQTASGLSEIFGLMGQGKMDMEKRMLAEQEETNEQLRQLIYVMNNFTPVYGGA